MKYYSRIIGCIFALFIAHSYSFSNDGNHLKPDSTFNSPEYSVDILSTNDQNNCTFQYKLNGITSRFNSTVDSLNAKNKLSDNDDEILLIHNQIEEAKWLLFVRSLQIQKEIAISHGNTERATEIQSAIDYLDDLSSEESYPPLKRAQPQIVDSALIEE